jgi:hypothetical protein
MAEPLIAWLLINPDKPFLLCLEMMELMVSWSTRRNLDRFNPEPASWPAPWPGKGGAVAAFTFGTLCFMRHRVGVMALCHVG